MKKLSRLSGWLVANVMVFGLSASAQVTLFSNTGSSPATQIFPGSTQPGYSLEYGNQVFFGNGYTAENITSFSFEYYAIGGNGGTAFSGTPTVDVRWYLNNGPAVNDYASPGTLVYNSGAVPLSSSVASVAGAANTLSFSASDFGGSGQAVNAGSLTWTVQFSGMGAGDNLGVVLASSAPTVPGTSVGADYWLNNGGWTLNQNGGSSDVIIQQWVGTAVPEPSTIALGLVGGLGLLFAIRRFRK